jgi:hypothetical protein
LYSYLVFAGARNATSPLATAGAPEPAHHRARAVAAGHRRGPAAGHGDAPGHHRLRVGPCPSLCADARNGAAEPEKPWQSERRLGCGFGSESGPVSGPPPLRMASLVLASYCMLAASYCVLAVCCCVLLGAAGCLLCAAACCWVLLGACCVLLRACCVLLRACCVLLGACCVLLRACCVLLGACCVLLGACCVLVTRGPSSTQGRGKLRAIARLLRAGWPPRVTSYIEVFDQRVESWSKLVE